MMYHCIPIGCCSPSHAELLKNGLYSAVHAQVHQPQKNSKKGHGNQHYPGGRDHILAGWPRDLLQLHASVVEEFLCLTQRARDLLTYARRCSGDGVPFAVLHFYCLRGHLSLDLLPAEASLPPITAALRFVRNAQLWQGRRDSNPHTRFWRPES